MRALVQRVDWAEVLVAGQVAGQIDRGLLVYVGVAGDDAEADATRLAEKVAQLRVFEDDGGKMNLSCQDVRGGVLAVSNFTLLADTRKGRRPAFAAAAGPEHAERLYEAFCAAIAGQSVRVEHGVFRANMIVRSSAAGPVNLIVETGAGSRLAEAP
jgi:D-tyrosyl-tRNA(Tyr) deacylase